jgi:Na+-transporting methylmalonyl-CoA/oxaloacetate decarboxylase gamma subunit
VIEALLLKFGLGRFAAKGLLFGLLCLALVLVMWRVGALIDRRIVAAAAAAIELCNAEWKAEIAKANALAEAARAAQAIDMAATEARAADDMARLKSDLITMEKANAGLPGGNRCGLGRDRVRLLNASP